MTPLQDAAHRRSPVEVLVDAELADEWPVDRGPPPAWSVCQGWRGAKGHTFIVADTHDNGPATGVVILEANRAYGLDGVGWRGHGMATAATPPALWYRDPRAWTWARLRGAYPEIAVASLRTIQDPTRTLAELERLPERDMDRETAPEGGGSIPA